MIQGRCMKCKEAINMKDPVITQTPRGGFMAKGKCHKCGTTVCAMMSKDKADKAIKDGAKKSF